MGPLTALYLDVPEARRLGIAGRALHLAAGGVLSPLYWLAARLHGAPGLHLHGQCLRLAARVLARGRLAALPPGELYRLVLAPFDSTRYFELEFAWETLRSLPGGPRSHLDVSSPRLITLAALLAHPDLQVTMLNPHRADLDLTARYVRALGLQGRCRLVDATVEGFAAAGGAGPFQTITCLSVLEHIPDFEPALRRIWSLLAAGGRLLLTLPCMARSVEQYISRDEYGLLAPGADGYTFWQRFFDRPLLEERVFPVVGAPARLAVFGEKVAGSFQRNARRKREGGAYPFWREPYMVAREYAFFPDLDSLPGEGVVAMELVKP